MSPGCHERHLTWLAIVLVFLAPSMAVAESSPARVLVVHSFHHEMPWHKSVRRGMVAGGLLDQATLEVYEEEMDAARLDQGVGLFVRFLQNRYQDLDLDLVVYVSEPASRLLISHPRLFEATPRLVVDPAIDILNAPSIPDNVTFVEVDSNVVLAFDQLQKVSSARRIAIVGETRTPFVAALVDELRSRRPGDARLSVEFLVDLPMDQLLARVSAMPPQAAVFFLPVFWDGDGHSQVPRAVVGQVAAAAPVPTFVHFDTLFGNGAVGGLMVSGERVGRHTADHVRRMLNGPATSRADHTANESSLAHIYDARALDRFGIAEASLPAGSLVHYRQPTVWSEYREYVIGALAVISLLVLVGVLMGITLSAINRSRLQLERARSQLQRAQVIARLGGWTWDLDSDTLILSDRLRQMLGLEKARSTVDCQDFLELVALDDRPAFEQAVAESLKNRSEFHIQFRLNLPSGRQIHLDHRGAVRVDGNGNPVRMEGTSQDITERKALEVQVQRAQRVEAVGSLAGGVAHHFNNLFAAMLGNAELMVGAKADDAKQSVDELIRSIQVAAGLNRQLLAFSRRQTLFPVAADLNLLLQKLVPNLKSRLGQAIELDFSLAEGLWPATVDVDVLSDALLNILDNARDAMPDGGQMKIATSNVTIDEHSTSTLPAGDFVLLSARDTGAGASTEVQERMFNPFFTTKKVGEGRGLGLSMVYGFVKQSDGGILIDSAPGLGTTLRLYFPRARAAADDASSQ